MTRVGDIVIVDDKMQTGYSYELVAPVGAGFTEQFRPFHTTQEMLALDVFEGKYCNDCVGEFPEYWFLDARPSHAHDVSMNYFGMSTPL